MCDDLRGKTIEQIRDGCRRYRRDPKNVFFPTPGQLLEACRNPFADPPGRGYGALPELPSPLPHDVAAAIIEKRREQYGHFWKPRGEVSIAALKEEILARPKIPYVESTPEQKAERMAALERRLNARKTG